MLGASSGHASSACARKAAQHVDELMATWLSLYNVELKLRSVSPLSFLDWTESVSRRTYNKKICCCLSLRALDRSRLCRGYGGTRSHCSVTKVFPRTPSHIPLDHCLFLRALDRSRLCRGHGGTRSHCVTKVFPRTPSPP